MEVGHQPVDETEPVSRRNEEIGGSEEWRKLAVGVSAALEKPQRRGADRHDTPSPRLYRIQCRRGVAGDHAGLEMHDVPAGIGAADGKERAGSDMQRHEM